MHRVIHTPAESRYTLNVKKMKLNHRYKTEQTKNNVFVTLGDSGFAQTVRVELSRVDRPARALAAAGTT